jgi:hypothetical protein
LRGLLKRLKNALGAPVRPEWPARPLLKAGAGCFGVKFISGQDISTGGTLQFHIRARTWLADDMLGPDQIPMFGEGEAGNRLGELILLPLPLRAAIEDSGRSSP